MTLVRNLLVAASLASVATFAVAADTKTPNCEVKGKKSHMKDKAACEAKKGKWLEVDATTAAPAAAPAAPAAAPAEATKTPTTK